MVREMDSFFFLLFVSIVYFHMDSNIPWNIYYASLGSKNFRFARGNLELNAFLPLCNFLLNRKQEQESKCRSRISTLNKVFGKHFNVFRMLMLILLTLHFIYVSLSLSLSLSLYIDHIYYIYIYMYIYIYIYILCAFVFYIYFLSVMSYLVKTEYWVPIKNV